MFKLRELERKDLKTINAWRNDADLIAYLGAPFRYINLEVDEEWFNYYMANRGRAVRLSVGDEHDEIVGLVSLTDIDSLNQSAEAYIMIGNISNRGLGIGTFAMSALVKHAFYNMNLHRIESNVLSSNERSVKLLKKCGFHYEGTRKAAWFKNGKFEDQVIYACLREDAFFNS